MSYTTNDTAQWRRETGSVIRHALGAIRWVRVTLTSKALWQTVGHKLLGGIIETHDAAPFMGIGHYARPKAGANVEAVMVFVGGAADPIIIATRDEDMRKAMAQIDQDEHAVFNSKTVIIIKKDGTVEIRNADGAAVALATKQDLEILGAAMGTAVIALGGGGAATIVPAANALAVTARGNMKPPRPVVDGSAWPIGTAVLKAE